MYEYRDSFSPPKEKLKLIPSSRTFFRRAILRITKRSRDGHIIHAQRACACLKSSCWASFSCLAQEVFAFSGIFFAFRDHKQGDITIIIMMRKLMKMPESTHKRMNWSRVWRIRPPREGNLSAKQQTKISFFFWRSYSHVRFCRVDIYIHTHTERYIHTYIQREIHTYIDTYTRDSATNHRLHININRLLRSQQGILDKIPHNPITISVFVE